MSHISASCYPESSAGHGRILIAMSRHGKFAIEIAVFALDWSFLPPKPAPERRAFGADNLADLVRSQTCEH
jgi:hypothetical protein